MRDEMAGLLGYESWAHYRLETRMAKDPDTALGFLKDLQKKVLPKFDTDLAKMQETYEDPDGIDYWDWRYYQRRLMEKEYDIDTEALREYFPLDRCLAGMFDIFAELFDLEFRDVAGDPGAWSDGVDLKVAYDATTGEPAADLIAVGCWHVYGDMLAENA